MTLFINGNCAVAEYHLTWGRYANLSETGPYTFSYITVWNRTTRFDDGREIQWDVVGHDIPLPTFVTVFTFDTATVSLVSVGSFGLPH